MGFGCIIKRGDDYLYSFRIEPTTGGSFFRMLTEDLRLDTGLLDTFLPLVKAHYLDFIDRFEADPAEALHPVCAPFIQPEDYSWCIHVDEQMVERYGTPEQLAEYRRQAELRGTPEHKAKNWMGSMLFYLSHANDVDHAWASSRTREELDQVVEPPLCRPSGGQDSGHRRMRRAISSTGRKQTRRSAPFGYGISSPTPWPAERVCPERAGVPVEAVPGEEGGKQMSNQLFQQNLDDKRAPSPAAPISFRCCSKSRYPCRTKRK